MKLTKFSKFAWGVLGWNLLVIVWGAYVRATGSGAGCGRHWPKCNGEIIPRNPALDTQIEYMHRLLSAGALMLVGILVFWGWRMYQKGAIVRKGLAVSGILIIAEALLGAGLVLLQLVGHNDTADRAVAMALHLANTFLLLGALSLTAYWASGGKNISIKNNRQQAVLLGIGLLGIMLIGMSGAVTALGDTLFPVKTLAEGLHQDSQPNAHFLIRLRVYHPVIAVSASVYTLYLIRYYFKNAQATIKRSLLALGTLTIIQLAAGMINLLLLAPIPMQIIHLFLADLVWITYVISSAAILTTPTATA
ncbi:MAG: COX15/CtaA family protein [Anaerolineales bacterium]|nr:COX15/CtaA family protein [Anaerolineales bacterium]